MQTADLDLTNKLALTANEVASIVGLSRASVYRLIKSGVLPGFLIGNSVRVSVDDLRQWIAKQPRIEGSVAVGDLLARRAYNRRNQA